MNFKSQKGATGVDIIVSITVIVLSVAVVSMIYVNTTLQSRNVSRTAGATRIATNILENINKMSYADFLAEYDSTSVGWQNVTTGNFSGYKSTSNTTTFNTKIPKGYTLYLKATPEYGSHTDASERFDLVKDIKLAVTFKVGDKEEVVDFTTTKRREVINDVNEPNTDILSMQGIIKSDSGKNFYPIKYSDTAKAYIITTEDDSEWYDYANKKWAMVIVSNGSQNELFDINGKFIGKNNYARYVWIPRFFYKKSGSADVFSEFTYLTTDKAIKQGMELKSTDNPSTATLFYTTYGTKDGASLEYAGTEFMLSGNQKVTGKWINAGTTNTTTEIEKDVQGKLLNNSKYGPCEIH